MPSPRITNIGDSAALNHQLSTINLQLHTPNDRRASPGCVPEPGDMDRTCDGIDAVDNAVRRIPAFPRLQDCQTRCSDYISPRSWMALGERITLQAMKAPAGGLHRRGRLHRGPTAQNLRGQPPQTRSRGRSREAKRSPEASGSGRWRSLDCS